MNTKEREMMIFKIMDEPIEAVKEFNEEMKKILNKDLNNQELKDEVSKLKKKYSTQK